MEITDSELYYRTLMETANESGILQKMQKYISHVRSAEYSVADEEMVQNFILETRKADDKIGIPELHLILVLARCLTIARGEVEANEKYLIEAKELMKKLNDRL